MKVPESVMSKMTISHNNTVDKSEDTKKYNRVIGLLWKPMQTPLKNVWKKIFFFFLFLCSADHNCFVQVDWGRTVRCVLFWPKVWKCLPLSVVCEQVGQPCLLRKHKDVTEWQKSKVYDCNIRRHVEVCLDGPLAFSQYVTCHFNH